MNRITNRWSGLFWNCQINHYLTGTPTVGNPRNRVKFANWLTLVTFRLSVSSIQVLPLPRFKLLAAFLRSVVVGLIYLAFVLSYETCPVPSLLTVIMAFPGQGCSIAAVQAAKHNWFSIFSSEPYTSKVESVLACMGGHLHHFFHPNKDLGIEMRNQTEEIEFLRSKKMNLL